MIHRTTIYLCLTLLAILEGCSPSEPLIDSFTDTWHAVVVSMDGKPHIYEFPSGTETIGQITGLPDDAVITRVVPHLTEVYLVDSSRAVIYVFSTSSREITSTIVFPDSIGIASDLCPVNVATAFAVHPNSDYLSVIDLTVPSTVAFSKTAKYPHRISAIGNQLVIACRNDNKATIFDSRTLSFTYSVNVGTYPSYITRGPASEQAWIVSLGRRPGKDEGEVATASLLDLTQERVISTIDCAARQSDAVHQIPRGAITSSFGLAYIPVNGLVIIVSGGSRVRVSGGIAGTYSHIVYNPLRAEVILMHEDNRLMDVYSDDMQSQKLSFTFPFPVHSVTGIVL